MAKKIPFYGNTEDNMHCSIAVYRMLFDYFLDRKLSREEAEKLAGFADGKAAWTVTIWERMSNIGFDIHMIESFNYRRYAVEGEAYLQEYFKPEEYDWQLKHSNILAIRPQIASFLEKVDIESRSPTLQDIDDMLDDGRLVDVQVNARILNDAEGYAAHSVLVIARDGDDYIVHDPGLPPQPNRRIPRSTFWQAMGGDNNNAEVTGITLAPRPIRADVLLAALYPDYSRAALAKLFDKGLVTFAGRQLKAGDKISSDSAITADISSLTAPIAAVPVPILYEDDNVIVMNKPAGMLTHAQSKFIAEPTVATFLREKGKLEGERAGVVHRLDRPTSGVLVGAKHERALKWLQKQFADRTVKKAYVAIVQGAIKQPEAVIDMPIERNPKAPATHRVGPNGKPARTHYKVLKHTDTYSLVELWPETGRTHQLRVHLAHIGHPIVGDPLYGRGTYGDRLFLHALSLEITLPSGERKTFTAPLPSEFEEKLR
jgi:23S rRNA pseudouridine1911/1915/1917 synthase